MTFTEIYALEGLVAGSMELGLNEIRSEMQYRG